MLLLFHEKTFSDCVSYVPCASSHYFTDILYSFQRKYETSFSKYEAYPQNKFCLQIFLLQCCGHNGAHLCRFVGHLGRHGRHLQTTELVYTSFCVFTMFKKIEKPTTCEMSSVIRFLNAGNMKPADIYRQLCEVYREHAMSDSMVWTWVRHYIEGQENVHDDLWSGRLPVVNEGLVRAVEEKIQEDNSPFCHFT
jgi:hypothetical protein